jgi:hypothetical protein
MGSIRRVVVAILCVLMVSAACPVLGQEPSPEYKASLRKTLEKRKARRQGRPAEPPGLIVPWFMPPALIIRQTREVHGEMDSLLWGLRR